MFYGCSNKERYILTHLFLRTTKIETLFSFSSWRCRITDIRTIVAQSICDYVPNCSPKTSRCASGSRTANNATVWSFIIYLQKHRACAGQFPACRWDSGSVKIPSDWVSRHVSCLETDSSRGFSHFGLGSVSSFHSRHISCLMIVSGSAKCWLCWNTGISYWK